MNDDGIELCDIPIGGGRANAIIRGVVEHLAIRKNDKYVRASAKTLSDTIKNAPSAPTFTAAINDFRDLCVNKLREAGIEAGKDAVIFTAKGGGYQFREWIAVRIGREGQLVTEAEKDCAQVMRAFSRNCKPPVQQLRMPSRFLLFGSRQRWQSSRSAGKLIMRRQRQQPTPKSKQVEGVVKIALPLHAADKQDATVVRLTGREANSTAQSPRNSAFFDKAEESGACSGSVLACRYVYSRVAEHVVLPSSHRAERGLFRQRLRLKARSGRKDFLPVEPQGGLSFLFRLSEPRFA